MQICRWHEVRRANRDQEEGRDDYVTFIFLASCGVINLTRSSSPGPGWLPFYKQDLNGSSAPNWSYQIGVLQEGYLYSSPLTLPLQNANYVNTQHSFLRWGTIKNKL